MEFSSSNTVNLCYYITGHGLGHATRSVEIVRALLETSCRFHIHIVCSVDHNFFVQNLASFDRSKFTLHNRMLDTGAIQSNPLAVDALVTLDTYYSKIHLRRQEILDDEAKWLQSCSIKTIVADATPLACAAGKQVGIKVILLTNFSWDFCFRGMLDAITTSEHAPSSQSQHLLEMVDQCSQDVCCADIYCQLPGATPLPPGFDPNRVLAGPLLARRSTSDIRQCLQSDPMEKILLLGFGGHAASWELRDEFLPPGWVCYTLGLKVEEMPSARFKALPFNVHVPDYIHAADVVLGKVGYGFVSECLAHGTPLIYVSRSNWPEERCLIDLLRGRYGAGLEMSAGDFASGAWAGALEQALALKGSWVPGPDHDPDSAADKIVRLISDVAFA